MTEGNKMFIKIVFITAVILTAFFIFTRLPAIGDGKAQDNSGVPDVVSSRTQNDDCYLTVVANSESINEQKAFAERVIHMYRENAFHTTKFSTDRDEMPKKLHITIYLNKSDVRRGRESFGFVYNVDTDRYLFE